MSQSFTFGFDSGDIEDEANGSVSCDREILGPKHVTPNVLPRVHDIEDVVSRKALSEPLVLSACLPQRCPLASEQLPALWDAVQFIKDCSFGKRMNSALMRTQVYCSSYRLIQWSHSSYHDSLPGSLIELLLSKSTRMRLFVSLVASFSTYVLS